MVICLKQDFKEDLLKKEEKKFFNFIKFKQKSYLKQTRLIKMNLYAVIHIRLSSRMMNEKKSRSDLFLLFVLLE